MSIIQMLSGGDKRSIGKSDEVTKLVLKNNSLFILFNCLLVSDELIRMRAADAIEKVTITKPELLKPFKNKILNEVANIHQQEVEWHVAQLIPRLDLTPDEFKMAVIILNKFIDNTKSNIVKVFFNAITG